MNKLVTFSIDKYSEAVQELCRQRIDWDKYGPELRSEWQTTNYAEQFSLTDSDVPQLLEIARCLDTSNADIPDDFSEAPLFAWMALQYFPAEQTFAALIGHLDHFDWQCEDMVFGLITVEESLKTIAVQSRAVAVPLLLTAIQNVQRHNRTQSLLLRLLSAAVDSTYLPQCQEFLFKELNELRIGYQNWYGYIVSFAATTSGFDWTPEWLDAVKRACLGGYVNIADFSESVKTTLKDVAGLDFEHDETLLPLYKNAVAVQWIMASYTDLGNHLPKQAISQTRKRRDTIIPALLESLRNGAVYVRNKVRHIDWSALIALYFLAEFKTKEALPILCDILSCHDDDVYELFCGDSLYEELPAIVYRLLDGDYQWCAEKLCDTATPLTLRGCLRESVKFFVTERKIKDEEYFALLRRCLEETMQNWSEEQSAFMGFLMCDISDTRQPDFIPLVCKAFDDELVEEGITRSEDCVDYLNGRGFRSRPFRQTLPDMNKFIDAEDALSQWERFDTKPQKGSKVKAKKHMKNTKAEDEPIPLPWDEPAAPVSYVGVGRNDMCPCGSGKKYKVCCMNKR